MIAAPPTAPPVAVEDVLLARSAASRNERRPRLNFGRVLLSEWIKFRTLESSFVLLGSAVLAMVAVSMLGAAGIVGSNGEDERLTEQAVHALPTVGLYFGQLVVAALAVLLISSEYGTGMIRSSVTAVPARTPVLVAKAVLAALLGAIVGIVGTFASYSLIQPILAEGDLDFALDSAEQWTSLAGTGLYLALIAVMALGIGTLLRHSAAGIVTITGLLFVLPTVLWFIPGDVAETIVKYLPSEAGNQLTVTSIADGALTQLQGGLVLAAWAVVPFVAAIVTMKRRDS